VSLDTQIKAKRGFATMDPEKQKQIASNGGKAAHAQGKAHKYTAEEAREAGKKGGASLAKNREHMARIGRAGGLKRQENARARAAKAANEAGA
jgi:general stress protein YciG